MPLFSVIIPNYNYAVYLEERIRSVLEQGYQDFELILLDDGSTDDSKSIIEKYRDHPKVSHVVYNSKNSASTFSQWKKGIELSAGDWIWIAESDDSIKNDFLQEAANAISGHPTIGLFYCDGVILEEGGSLDGKRFSSIKNHIFKTRKWTTSYFSTGRLELNDFLKFDNTINNVSGTVFKKDLLTKISPGFESFRYYGDWFLYIQLAMITDIYYCSLDLNLHRKHESSVLNSATSPTTSRTEYFRILKLLTDSPVVTAKKDLVNHFGYHFLHLGLFTHSPKSSLSIITNYMRIDMSLALKVLPRLVGAKLFRKTYRESKVIDVNY
ncbi:MAG: glycosyltransferase [Chitinophagaceae bacterium]|nr:glycosyltransferase [Chitinophagaceae bacterium]